jgi:hypothetical protein
MTRTQVALAFVGLVLLANATLGFWTTSRLGAVDEWGTSDGIDEKVAAIRNGEVPPEKVALYLKLRVLQLEAIAATARSLRDALRSASMITSIALLGVVVAVVLQRKEKGG